MKVGAQMGEGRDLDQGPAHSELARGFRPKSTRLSRCCSADLSWI